MTHIRHYLQIGLIFLFVSCSIQRQQVAEYIQTDLIAIQQARSAWDILSDPQRTAEWEQAYKLYNKSVRIIARHLKQTKRQGGFSEQDLNQLPFVIAKMPYDHGNSLWYYEQIFMADEVDVSFRLKESVTAIGMGVPLAGLTPQSDTKQHQNTLLKNNGNIHTLTAILDFDTVNNGKPVLKAIPRLINGHINIGPRRVRQPLAANFSAPIALFWQLSDADGTALLGAFRPAKTINIMGLYFSEPYDPHKIPIIFTHGLLSSPAAFANLTNRLLVDPVIRENFQFWFFGYPSGLAWPIPAKMQRQALAELRQTYNTHGHSKEMNNIVMIGHSMGGLITRLNNSTKPWLLLKGFINLPADAFDTMTLTNWREKLAPLQADVHTMTTIHDNFIFPPIQGVSRIVYMATPHRGSDLADDWIGHLGQYLTTLPADMLEQVTRIATLSRGMILLNPMQVKNELTGIYQLAPNSPLIKNMPQVHAPDTIPVHSIIGDRGKNNSPDSTDGVVPYYSSHLDWSVSEKIVPSNHSVQNDPATAIELRRILREHLRRVKGDKIIRDAELKATTPIWQINPKVPLILSRP